MRSAHIGTLLCGLLGTAAASTTAMIAPSLVLRNPTCRRDPETIASYRDSISGASGDARYEYGKVGGLGAASVCVILNHNLGMSQPCYAWGGIVSAIVYASIGAAANTNSGPVGTTGGPGRRRRGSALPRDHARLLASLGALGFEWESTGDSPVARRRAPLDPNVLDRIVLHGFRQAGDPTGPQADVSFVTFADGTGTATVTATESPSSSTLDRRHDGAGFKVNWNILYYNYPALAADDSFDEIRTVALDMAGGISRDFVWRAETRELDAWIGSVRIWNSVTRVMAVALRIIPERTGFGENYEDVAVCGVVNE